MGDVRAKNGRKIAKTGDSAAANTTGGQVAQARNRLVKGGGSGGSGAKGDRRKAKASATNGRVKGEPVSVIDGQVVREVLDLALPAPIPVTLRRIYSSAFRDESTPLGRGGWTHELHQWVARVDGELTLRGEDGRNLALPSVDAGGRALHRGRRLAIARHEGDRFEVESLDSFITRVFAPVTKDGPAMLRELRDRWGNRVELRYEDARLVAVRACGRELRFTHDDEGRVVRVDAWAGGAAHQSVSFAYAHEGELARATDALGFSERYAYDGLHRLTKTTFKNGVSFRYEYDDVLDRCTSTRGDDDLYFVELIYDLAARTTYTADYEARKYTWNDRGALVREETPDGDFAIEYAYDDDLLVVEEKNAAGDAIRYEYDARGNRTAMTDPAGNVTRWEYQDDLPVRRITPDGMVTEYDYDRRGALRELRTPAGIRYQLTYTGAGALAGVFGPEGPLAGFDYDEQQNLVYRVDARRAPTAFTYDPLGRPLSRSDALGQTTRIDYDALGQPTLIERADGTRVALAYDALGNVVRRVDPMGRVTTMEYQGTGVLAKQTMPDGQVWRFEYDGIERITDIINPKAETYEFQYDRAGRVVQEKTFDNRVVSYQYSRANRLLRVENPDGTSRAFQYDPLGNVVLETSPHGRQTYRRDDLGRLVEAAVIEHNGKTVIQFERDAFGRVVAEIQNGDAVRYEHDAYGRRVSRRLPDGETTRYAYDVAGALAKVEHDGQTLTFQRDALGREVQRSAAAGKVDLRSRYDAMGRLTDRWATTPRRTGEAAQAILSQRRWSYDPNGRVIALQDARWRTTAYAYSEIGQLIEAHRATLHEYFDYDGAGSLTQILHGLARFDESDQWRTREGGLLRTSPDADFEYDANHRRQRLVHRRGTQETGEVTEYFWDCRDRLREVRLPSGERVLYTYDAFGRRVRKEIVPADPPAGTVPSEPPKVRVVRFLWDGNALAQEVDTERGKRVYVHEPGMLVPMLQEERGEVFTVITDHLGTPKELVDGAGAVAWTTAHAAWGGVVESDVPAARAGFRGSPFRLLGQYHDEETGLCYARFRYFDPGHGRWISPDPLGIAGGENLFGFDGTPTTDVDPLGLCGTGQATTPPRTLIHYTNERGRAGILESKEIRASQGPTHARYGPGQYFSDIPPEDIGGQTRTTTPSDKMSLGELSARFYRIPWNTAKVSHFVEIDVTDLEPREVSPNNWLVSGNAPLDVSGRIVRSGKTIP